MHLSSFKFLLKSALAHYETMSFLATVASCSDRVRYRSDGANLNSKIGLNSLL